MLAEGLFHALPVRRRWAAASGKDEEVVFVRQRIVRLALLQPRVEFRCSLLACSRAPEHLELPAVLGIAQRVSQILGGHCMTALRDVSHEARGCSLDGVISMPDDPQASDRFMFLFVNGRCVDNTPLHAFMGQVYTRYVELLACGGMVACSWRGPLSMAAVARGQSWPMFVLNLSCSPDCYDIGYSPDRTVVEFHDWQVPIGVARGLLRQLFAGDAVAAAALSSSTTVQEMQGSMPTAVEIALKRAMSEQEAQATTEGHSRAPGVSNEDQELVGSQGQASASPSAEQTEELDAWSEDLGTATPVSSASGSSPAYSRSDEICGHYPGSGRGAFASRSRSPRASLLETSVRRSTSLLQRRLEGLQSCCR